MPFLLLMPSYNQAHFIVDAVRSVLAQDDADWELWIVDNSSDSTPQAMAQFQDPRIHFHHISTRMDPGSCLNWMLERVRGRDFSYVHTDNNLHPSYVRRMRAALSVDPCALAYCDMRTIDEHGRYLNVYKRGEFDLARLLSVDSLGVPFAATLELAKRVGGFSARDYADDVRFCVCAYGVARYVYVRDALVDYRLHANSRTEEAGGSGQMQNLFVKLMPRLAPLVEQSGLQPLPVMEEAIRQGFEEADSFVEDVWYRKTARVAKAWWNGFAKVDHFFFAGLLHVAGSSRWKGRPAVRSCFLGDKSKRFVWPWQLFLAWMYLRLRQRELRRIQRRTRDILLGWAAIKLTVDGVIRPAVRVRSLDFRTIWSAQQLRLELGVEPKLDESVDSIPSWLKWNRADGTEPLLDCSEQVSLQFGTEQ